MSCIGSESERTGTLTPLRRTGSSAKPVGDGYDDEPLLTAEEVGEILRVPVKSVYDLPIKRVWS